MEMKEIHFPLFLNRDEKRKEKKKKGERKGWKLKNGKKPLHKFAEEYIVIFSYHH